MKTISALDDLPVFKYLGDELTVLAEVKKMDFFARVDETRKKGKTWSKIILSDGEMGWVESKKTFEWRPIQVGQRNLFCTSLEKETLNGKVLLPVGSTIYIVANEPKVLVRLGNHQLGELPESFKIRSAPAGGSSKVLTIITGMICVFTLYMYSFINNIDIYAKFSQPRIFMGLHPKYFMYGVVITGIVMVSSYFLFDLLGSGVGEVKSIFSKLKKTVLRELKIRK
ncbi:MAG: hypothetical protein AB8F94_23520 [Saprospiraceae bacterium]